MKRSQTQKKEAAEAKVKEENFKMRERLAANLNRFESAADLIKGLEYAISRLKNNQNPDTTDAEKPADVQKEDI